MAIKIDIPGLTPEPVERLTPAAERILSAASKLFYWRGIHAVGVETIAREASVTKKTIFDQFGSKGELIAAYLRRRDRLWRLRIRDALTELKGDDPKQMILAAFSALEGWVQDENPRGCAFVNAYAELTDDHHPGYQVIMDQKFWLQGFFTEISTRAGVSNPEKLSEKLLILYEGGTVVNSMHLAESPVSTARKLAEDIIDSCFFSR
jgi:AcrR family transcriptional regulator